MDYWVLLFDKRKHLILHCPSNKPPSFSFHQTKEYAPSQVNQPTVTWPNKLIGPHTQYTHAHLLPP
jgi:hypothetical protein